MQAAWRQPALWGSILAATLVAFGCTGHQKSDSDGLTGHTPKRLAADQKRKLRACVFAAAERSYAETHDGNVTGTLRAVRGALKPPEGSDAKFRARRNDWDLDWSADRVEHLRIRFGTRGLEIAGRANRPPDVTELYRRLETDRELPDLHVRMLEGNEVEGFRFHFVEKTLPELTSDATELGAVYARAREMGVEPVMRDVCPGRQEDADELRSVPRGEWSRTVTDIPGAWRLSGYETKLPEAPSGETGAIYELSEQKSKWDTVELELRDEALLFRVADLIPDPDYTYRPASPLPERVERLAETRGVESWASFDACPRSLCGLEPSKLKAAGPREIQYLTKLIRRIDEHRTQLYDLQAASWIARPVRSGVECSEKILESTESVSRLELDLEGRLRLALSESGLESEARERLESCSDSVVRKATAKSSETGTELAATLDNSSDLHPGVLDYDPKWAERDFVDGAEQLRYIVRNRTAPAIGSTLERIRRDLDKADDRLMSRKQFLETVARSLLAPPFPRVEVTPLPTVELSPGIEYHRVSLRAEAPRQATAQFFTLLEDLQDDRMILVEQAEWRTGSRTPEMETTLGVLSRN